MTIAEFLSTDGLVEVVSQDFPKRCLINFSQGCHLRGHLDDYVSIQIEEFPLCSVDQKNWSIILRKVYLDNKEFENKSISVSFQPLQAIRKIKRPHLAS